LGAYRSKDKSELLQKDQNRTAKVFVLGLGIVGLPLADLLKLTEYQDQNYERILLLIYIRREFS